MAGHGRAGLPGWAVTLSALPWAATKRQARYPQKQPDPCWQASWGGGGGKESLIRARPMAAPLFPFATPGRHYVMRREDGDLSKNPKAKASRQKLHPDDLAKLEKLRSFAEANHLNFEAGLAVALAWEQTRFSRCTPFLIIVRRNKREYPRGT